MSRIDDILKKMSLFNDFNENKNADVILFVSENSNKNVIYNKVEEMLSTEFGKKYKTKYIVYPLNNKNNTYFFYSTYVTEKGLKAVKYKVIKYKIKKSILLS